MSARAVAALVVLAGAAGAAYFVLRARQDESFPLDNPAVHFDWYASDAPVPGVEADPGEYQAGTFDAVGDAVLPIAYKIENVFSSVWGGRMDLSLAGLAHLKQFEGLRLQPYKDSGGLWTIGYGHLLKSGEWWDSITEAQAAQLLADDVGTAEDAVNALVKVSMTQPQFDALVSFVYNVGVGAFRRSTLLRKLNAGDYAGAAGQFQLWRNAGGRVVQGLVNRRAAEVALFAGGGVYS